MALDEHILIFLSIYITCLNNYDNEFESWEEYEDFETNITNNFLKEFSEIL